MKFYHILLISLTPIAIAGLFLYFLTAAIVRSVYFPIAFIKICCGACSEADRDYRLQWLSDLEPYQLEWLKRHGKIEAFLKRTHYYSWEASGLYDLTKGTKIAQFAFEDVALWRI